MKYKISDEQWQPFDLTITVETPEDAARIFSFFNHATICKIWDSVVKTDAFADQIATSIRSASRVKQSGHHTMYHDEICNILREI